MASTGSILLSRRGLEALHTLERIGDRTDLTPEEREVLMGWPGWGPLAPALDAEQPEGAWTQIAQEVDDFFGDSDTDALEARETVDTAFYTPNWLIDRMWDLLIKAGFKGGKVLEPGCGSGRFIMRAPKDLPIEFVGVEKDHTSARIARALNPDAVIHHSPLQSTRLGDTLFDAVIGNVPFGSGQVSSGTTGWWSQSLHAYFLGRALAQTRAGGYVVLITSRHLMDGMNSYTCTSDSTRCDFVGAVRLPTGAFGSEGTEVVADIVVFRRTNGEVTRGAPRQVALDRSQFPAMLISQYWQENPECVAGTMTRGTHFARPIVVTAENPQEAVASALSALEDRLLPMTANDGPELDLSGIVLADDQGRPEGSFHLEEDGSVVRIQSGEAVKVTTGAKELRHLVALREAVEALMQGEANLSAPDEDLMPLREAAKQAWETYVSAFGPLNRGTLHEGKVDADTGLPTLSWRRPTMGGFRSDPSYPLVMAVEVYDPDTGEASPAPILLHRVNRPPVPVSSADTPTEALNISLGETGLIDLERIADLLSMSGADREERALAALGDQVFRDPEDLGNPVLARTYLSGNIRSKLARAETAAQKDSAYARNVEALRQVMPADLGPHEIKAAFGAPWISPEDIQAFGQEVLNSSFMVYHCAETSTWNVDNRSTRSVELTTTYGTSEMNAAVIIHHLLNGKPPVVYQTERVNGRDRKVRDNAQTLAVQEKALLLQERFEAWVWEGAERSERLCAEYNRRFNSYVVRRPDGSHLTFPGMSTDRPLWDWQRDMVDQIVTSGATLCGHAVGSGKTLTTIASVMTLKRFGLASKPMIVVPNHLLEQIAREARQAYPMGRFLIAGQEDLAGEGRRLFAARCATGDWDAVVVTHSGFTSIPVAAEAERAFVLDQKLILDDALRSTEEGFSPANHFSSKAIARRLRSLNNQLEKLRANVGDDQTVRFEQLGVDFLAVDEAHMFKRLAVGASTQMGSSKRATDLLLKIRMLRDRNAGRPHVALFTGTPWTNTLAETFVWQTYLQPEVLEAAGLSSLDAWMAQFVKTETKIEVSPDGSSFRMHTRPTALRNVPELRTILNLNADILPSSALPLKRPDRRDSTMVCQRTPEQADYVATLVERAEHLRSGGGGGGAAAPREDNMLVICGEGRRVALDPALMGLDGGSPKVTKVAAAVAKVYRENKGRTFGNAPTPGALQIVFCDIGTPNASGNQTYGRLREALVAEGVPTSMIRWVHEAKTDKAKDALFAACRDGSVAVLIGSTEKMGYGTNVQTRLVAVHHMDAPWRPSDIEQRDGRALRPGNLCEEVDIYRYVVERTFDSYMWQTLERKAFFVAQMMQADSTVREVEDISDAILDFGQVKALATGNPVVLELFTWREEARRLRTLRAVDRQSLTSALYRAKECERVALELELQCETMSKWVQNPSWSGGDRDDLQLEYLSRQVSTRARSRKQTYSYQDSLSTSWRGVHVEVLPPATHYWDGPRDYWTLRVRQNSYATPVTHWKLSLRSIRSGAAKIQEMLTEILTEWHAGVPDLLVRKRKQVEDLRIEAENSRKKADEYSFPHEARLREAEAKVVEIQDLIEQSVEPAQQGAEPAEQGAA